MKERTVYGYLLSLPNPSLEEIPYLNEQLFIATEFIYFSYILLMVVDFALIKPANQKNILVIIPILIVAVYLTVQILNFGQILTWNEFLGNLDDIMEGIEKLLIGSAFYYLRTVFVHTLLKLKKPMNYSTFAIENVGPIGEEQMVEKKHSVDVKNYSQRVGYKVMLYSCFALL